MTKDFDEAVAAVHGALGFLKRNLVTPVRTCTYEHRTYAGMRNRWLRDRGQGERLYRFEDQQYFFEGFDREDYRLFLNLMDEKLPHCFMYEDVWETEVMDWLAQNAQGEYRHTFHPMFITGSVHFSNENDAFFFKLSMSRPNGTGCKLKHFPELVSLPATDPVMKFVERFCLRTCFSVVAYVKSWFGGRDEPVRSR